MIGVLIPVHNEEALLGECLKSALVAARHPELLGETVQILTVLDSCNDGSAAIVQAGGFEPLACHEDVQLVRNLERCGASIAWSPGHR